jgi:hypothetical protein
LVSLQLAAPPMMLFAGWIKHPLSLAVQGSHDTDARKHRRAAERYHQDQRLHSGLPLRGLVLGLRELGDVLAGVLERDKRAPARQRDRFVERPFPARCSRRSDARVSG